MGTGVVNCIPMQLTNPINPPECPVREASKDVLYHKELNLPITLPFPFPPMQLTNPLINPSAI